MITEKLKSLMRFGTRSTRYKDVFDICYLSDLADVDKLRFCIQKYIYADTTIDVNDAAEIRKRAERIFTSDTYKKQVERSKKNWLDMADMDLGVAKHLMENYYPKPLEIICYRCQQAAEKAIKAVVIS